MRVCECLRGLGWVGLEPTTNALKGRCSTIELPTRERRKSSGLMSCCNTEIWNFSLLGAHERCGATFQAEEEICIFKFPEVLWSASIEVFQEHRL